MSGYVRAMAILRALAGLRRPRSAASATAAVIVLSAMLTARIGELVLSLHVTPAGGDSRSAERAPEPAGPPTARPNVAQQRDLVISAHLFGFAPPGIGLAPSAAPSQWVLTGTIQETNPGSGYAILGENAESMHVRAVGQEVFGGFTLVQVLRDRVTLERRGQRLALQLPRTRRGAHGAPGDAVALAAGTPAPLAKGIWHPRTGLIGVPLPAQAVLLPQVRRDADGRYHGIQVMSSDSRLSSLGLQHADVITEINGRAITSASEAQQALQQLSSGTTAMVVIERDGSPMQVPLTISEDGGT